MIALKWRDVHDDQIVLHSRKASARMTYRYLPISTPLRRMLRKLRASAEGCRMPDGDSYVFPHHDAGWWMKCLARATADLPVFGERRGVGNYWHLLRATWAVRQARAGATLWELMQLGGWTNPQTPMRYINLAGVAAAQSRRTRQ